MTREEILKVNQPRKHKIKNSVGVRQIYNIIKHNKQDINNISLPQFRIIIRTINKILAEHLSKGEDIQLPCYRGTLELRKNKPYIKIKDNKIKTDLPINWDKTLQLWEQNQEAYNNRQLIRQEEKEIFKFKYNKRNARYNNQCFFDFQVNREIKKKLKLHIKEGSIDAFNLND